MISMVCSPSLDDSFGNTINSTGLANSNRIHLDCCTVACDALNIKQTCHQIITRYCFLFLSLSMELSMFFTTRVSCMDAAACG
jgi:hypothetical protein